MPDAPANPAPAAEPPTEPGASPAGEAAPSSAPSSTPPPARRSVWTPKQKLVRVAWTLLARPAWILFPPLRARLLRSFGGRVGQRCTLPRDVEITIPWHIRIGDDVRIAERVVLYSLGVITIEDGASIDYRAHLCAGTHDMTDSTFPLLKPPITIGAGTFVGLDAYIGPGVELGRSCRVWPRASVYKSAPAGTHIAGNPGRSVDPGETDALTHRAGEDLG
ncbi:MAG: putative colanic acid biosynthesis acetyltransferase [Planctomycetota bacterium]